MDFLGNLVGPLPDTAAETPATGQEPKNQQRTVKSCLLVTNHTSYQEAAGHKSYQRVGEQVGQERTAIGWSDELLAQSESH